MAVYRGCTSEDLDTKYTVKQVQLLAHFMFRAQRRDAEFLANRIGYEVNEILAHAFGGS